MHRTPSGLRAGAPSPTSAAGTTGRVGATVDSPSANASGNSTPALATESASIAAAPGVATAPDGTVMHPAPLGLQASVLSKPCFYPSFGEDMGDFTEEGDILYPVLGDPWSRIRSGHSPGEGTGNTSDAAASPADVRAAPLEPSTTPRCRTIAVSTGSTARPCALSSSLSSTTALCVQPVLILPRKVGVSLAGEVFCALLCLHNAATYPLTHAHLRIDEAQPPAPQRRALLRRTVPVLPPKSNYTITTAVPLDTACNYSLTVTVVYKDPSERQRQLSWSSTLKTEQSIIEVQRRLAYLRPCVPAKCLPHSPSPLPSSSAPTLRTYACYQLTIDLKNMSSVPLVITSSELLLPALTYHDGKPLFRHLTPAETVADCDRLCDRNSEVGTATPSPPALLMPGDTKTLVFFIGVYLEELRHATIVHGHGGVTNKLLSPSLTSFGHVQWTWCRANGETGTVRSAPLRVEQLVAEPDAALCVTGVAPAAVAGTPTAEAAPWTPSPSPTPSPLLLAGYPITVFFALSNPSTIHRYDVALKVRVERLAPQWLYTGPTVRPIGLLEPSSTLTFSLNLLPWQAGWLQVAQAALEVVDAQMLEAVLWPPASTSLLQPLEGHTESPSVAAAGQPALVATEPSAMRATLPADGDVLCEVLVM
ncbi:hypothetical protein ABL78_8135 [Leptomonas seymouri]|uniref:Uncharacterized protein n=1 Tax=Leptomonas seymouri TaxID=5684 RepID=A0A0N1IHB8_LEPSE|nr:hypothetical protein ABL78_8135 [Leptomonas seymouri]|eukprot:KPI82855.1 hypothetical protein ABL78_8135 [Leptomonas seymouri]